MISDAFPASAHRLLPLGAGNALAYRAFIPGPGSSIVFPGVKVQCFALPYDSRIAYCVSGMKSRDSSSKLLNTKLSVQTLLATGIYHKPCSNIE